jgi:hypothetical protein
MDTRATLASTKAGRRLMGFMAVVNSGDPDRIRDIVHTSISEDALNAHGPDVWTAQLQYIHAMSGGLRVMQVIASEELRVVAMMQAHKNQRLHIIDLAVEEEYPYRIARFIQRVAQPGDSE